MIEYQIIKEKGGYRIWEHTQYQRGGASTDDLKPLELYDEYYQAALARVDLYRKLPAAELWKEE
ncbi:hypothetical protein [uncultured Faecalibaculum sp.]|uniref:hypothetical protein n=1 Tax=uncultured Faecalibaculum sp. TaxID=1729681 RepID=UPI0025E05511|nr:hypothetical protein [uncultured Faecalibaculum sp.]